MTILYRLKKWLRGLQSHLLPQHYLLLLLGLLALIAIVLVVSLKDEPDPLLATEMDPIYDRAVLRVGVREDVPKFCMRQGDTYTGIEAEIAHALAERIFSDPTKVEFVKVDFTTRGIKLKTDAIDCLIAVSPQGFSSDFVYSDAYYTDAVGIVVMAQGASSVTELSGKTIGSISRAGSLKKQGALDVLKDFNQSTKLGCTIKEYTSAPDMFGDLKNGKIDAIALESALIQLYFTDSMRLLPDAIGTIPYAIAVMPGNKPLAKIATDMLSSMFGDTSLYALWDKYGLRDFRVQ